MTTPRDETVAIEGIETHLLRGGSGPPLVWLHGAGGNGLWDVHHAALAHRFDVLAPDMPNWGRSADAEWMDTMHDYVLHLRSVLAASSVARPVLAGHSLGGWLAAEYAATYPEDVAALVLVDSAGYPFYDASVANFFELVARGGETLATALFHQHDVAARYFKPEPTVEERLAGYRTLTSTARIAWHTWFEEKLPRRLSRITCPALVVWGRHDGLFPAAQADAFAEALPHGRAEVFEDCGHMVPQEAPDRLADRIAALAGVA